MRAGRRGDAEVAAAFLARLETGPGALVLSGPAGIGKSTRFGAILSEAAALGHRVLVTRAVEAETQLAFGGLVDLLGEHVIAVLPGLPPVQRVALEVALQRTTLDGEPPPPLALSLGVHAALRALAADRPTLIAIDDLPWLDPATERVLSYAVRRVAGSRIGLLAAVRAVSPAAPLPPLVGAVAGTVDRHWIEPMDLEAMGPLLRTTLGHAFRRPTLAWIVERSAGNPFLAIEIGRALDRAGGPAADPASLTTTAPDDLVRDRLALLPPIGRWALAAAACLGRPTVEVLAAADRDAPAGLEAGRAAGLVELLPGAAAGAGRTGTGTLIRFTHPLLAAGALGGLDAAERRALHARLAAVLDDPEERARHLALAAEGPDPAVAEALDAAADQAADRGAAEVAAELRILSVGRTPADDVPALCRRLVTAAESAIRAGDAPRGRDLLEHHLPGIPAGPDRAEVLRVLADSRSGDDWHARRELLERALAEAGDDPRRRGRIIESLVQTMGTLAEDQGRRVVLIREGVALAERQDDPETRVAAYLSCVMTEQELGLGIRDELLDKADALAPAMRGRRILFWPEFARALVEPLRDRHEVAHRILLELQREAEQRRDWDSRPLVALNLAWVEFALGRWTDALGHAVAAEDGARQNGQPHALAQALSVRSLIQSAAGALGPAGRAAEEAIAAAREVGTVGSESSGWAAAGQHALASGDPAAAVVALARATDPWLMAGFRGPGHLDFLVDRAEALVALGELDEAERIAALYEEVAARSGSASTVAGAAAVRGRLEGARGREEPALAALARAAGVILTVPLPFSQGRVLLAQGEVLRRFRRRGAAREALLGARARFATLGAAPWLRRAEAELARTGHRDPGAALAPTEQEVARLVAAGRSNREIADALFMSPHTVEAHLTRIYRSLGIRGRADLARLVASGALDGGGTGAVEGSG
ncbi:MAG: LuxR C-terminal-related transcriptional regulator [Chloroflexota bacterium]